MKAAVYYANGGPEVLRYEDVPDPVLGDGEILIRVAAIGVQGGDVLNRFGTPVDAPPHIVGYQAAGTVEAVGTDVAGFAVGDRVVSLGLDGSHAELRAAHHAFCWTLPDDVSFEQAAAVPTEFGTASDSLFEFGRVAPGETVLIHAAASGVGIAAVQLAHRHGARVLATASSDERLERLCAFGMDEGINYVTANFVDEVRRLTGGAGADVIVDGVGGITLQNSLRCLAYRGRCVSFGNAGREEQQFLDVSSMSGQNQSLTSYFLGAEAFLSPRPREVIASALADIARGELQVVVDRVFALEDAADAHEYIESRQAFGRVVMVP